MKETLATAESVYRVFDDILERLQPTHIVTQTQCKVCAVSLSDVEGALSARFSTRPEVIALEPNSLNDIYSDVFRLARACGVEDRGERLVISEIQLEMMAIAGVARATGRRPRVINVEWQEPLMAAGNWIPELTSMLGAENLFGSAGLHSPWLEWEEYCQSRRRRDRMHAVRLRFEPPAPRCTGTIGPGCGRRFFWRMAINI